jgi:hypothetical protein
MVKYVFILAGVMLLNYLSYDYGRLKYNNKLEQYKLEQSIINNQKIIELSKQNSEIQKKFVLNNLEKDREIYNLNQRNAAIISSLQSRPQRTASNPTTNTKEPTTEPTGAGSTGQQLFREDAEFLIGEATKAEIIKKSLISCRKDLEAVPNSK